MIYDYAPLDYCTAVINPFEKRGLTTAKLSANLIVQAMYIFSFCIKNNANSKMVWPNCEVGVPSSKKGQRLNNCDKVTKLQTASFGLCITQAPHSVSFQELEYTFSPNYVVSSYRYFMDGYFCQGTRIRIMRWLGVVLFLSKFNKITGQFSVSYKEKSLTINHVTYS